MKPVSEKTVRLFMSPLIEWSKTHKLDQVEFDDPAFNALRDRPDCYSVFKLLESRCYVSIIWYDTNIPYLVTLLPSGLSYLESSRDLIHERRWTRGLAIIAILISLVALLLEFQDRGWIFPAKTSPSAPQSSVPVQEYLSPAR